MKKIIGLILVLSVVMLSSGNLYSQVGKSVQYNSEATNVMKTVNTEETGYSMEEGWNHTEKKIVFDTDKGEWTDMIKCKNVTGDNFSAIVAWINSEVSHIVNHGRFEFSRIKCNKLRAETGAYDSGEGSKGISNKFFELSASGDTLKSEVQVPDYVATGIYGYKGDKHLHTIGIVAAFSQAIGDKSIGEGDYVYYDTIGAAGMVSSEFELLCPVGRVMTGAAVKYYSYDDEAEITGIKIRCGRLEHNGE